MNSNTFLMLAIAILIIPFTADADETVLYVHSVKAQIKQSPSLKAEKVENLTRGQKLKRISKKGIWFEVETESGTKGWVSKLFVKSSAPVGQAELFNQKAASAAKNSRRRSSSYAVSAATRGLTANVRTRGGRELHRSNNQALKKVEEYKVSPKQLESFEKASHLKGQ